MTEADNVRFQLAWATKPCLCACHRSSSGDSINCCAEQHRAVDTSIFDDSGRVPVLPGVLEDCPGLKHGPQSHNADRELTCLVCGNWGKVPTADALVYLQAAHNAGIGIDVNNYAGDGNPGPTFDVEIGDEILACGTDLGLTALQAILVYTRQIPGVRFPTEASKMNICECGHGQTEAQI